MSLLYIDNDPPRMMSEFDRMMYGLDVLRARYKFEKLSIFAPESIALVDIEATRYHPLTLIFGVDTYKEACAMFGIDPRGTEAKAYGFCAEMVKGATHLQRIDGMWVYRSREVETIRLNELWRAEFREDWSAHDDLVKQALTRERGF